MKHTLRVLVVLWFVLATACGSRAVGGDTNQNINENENENENANSNGAPSCEEGTCTGCCSPEGWCLSGQGDAECGQDGELCANCLLLAGSCEQGMCQGTQPCGPENCPGCCDNDTRCVAGNSSEACGQAGEACHLCSDGAVCISGVCCQDQDGDGYGVGCALGGDCDDTAPGIIGDCQSNGCPDGWAHVPAGTFIAGCSEGSDLNCGAMSVEQHERSLEGFCIEITEVPVSNFRECQGSGYCQALPSSLQQCNWSADPADDLPDHPMNCVPWLMAREHCQLWKGGDLPTEWQWEKAARGTNGDPFPWGSTSPHDCDICNYSWCLGLNENFYTWPVGYLAGPEGDSPYGVKDMCANVAEFTRSCTDGITDYEDCSLSGSTTETTIARGQAGFLPPHQPTPEFRLTTYYRATASMRPLQNAGLVSIGFRCVREIH